MQKGVSVRNKKVDRIVLCGDYVGDGAIGRTIGRFTWGRFKHTRGAFIFTDGTRIGFQSNHSSGCHFFEWYDNPESELFDVPISHARMQRVYEKAFEIEGCGYDMNGIWGFLRRRKIEHPDKYFCSEAWETCLRAADFFTQRLPAYKISPVAQLASPALVPLGYVALNTEKE